MNRGTDLSHFRRAIPVVEDFDPSMLELLTQLVPCDSLTQHIGLPLQHSTLALGAPARMHFSVKSCGSSKVEVQFLRGPVGLAVTAVLDSNGPDVL
jgi:hypothetical protein